MSAKFKPLLLATEIRNPSRFPNFLESLFLQDGNILNKKTINCACLGTTLKLPMTEATFIENAIMIIMAIILLI